MNKELLMEACDSRGVTLRDVADALGLDADVLRGKIDGNAMYSDEAQKIKDFLGIDDELAGDIFFEGNQ